MLAGFTVIVNVAEVPLHETPALVNTGSTFIVAVAGVVPLLTAVKEAMFPEPLAARPMDGVLLVQLYTVPAVAPVKLMAVVEAPLQTTWLVTVFTVGTGFTVMVNIVGVPVQVTAPLV